MRAKIRIRSWYFLLLIGILVLSLLFFLFSFTPYKNNQTYSGLSTARYTAILNTPDPSIILKEGAVYNSGDSSNTSIITEKKQLRLVEQFNVPTKAAFDVKVAHGHYAYIADWEEGLVIVDLSAYPNPARVSTYNALSGGQAGK